MNQLQVIRPYVKGNLWVFDDPARGLQAEPFVNGIDLMIDIMTADIPMAMAGFDLVFSHEPFASIYPVVELTRVANDYGGAWYRAKIEGRRMHGWLCPALLCYFPTPPDRLYASAGPRSIQRSRQR